MSFLLVLFGRRQAVAGVGLSLGALGRVGLRLLPLGPCVREVDAGGVVLVEQRLR